MDDGQAGRAREVFAVFLRLGLTSFGGPVAHLGYFRAEFVERRRWLTDAAYADLVALCQFLPGPASSQVGVALGMLRGGWGGALAAFAGFTLPSAILMIAFAYGAARMDGALWSGALAGLKIVAVAIVAQAVLGMARNLCPDAPRAGIAAGAVVLLAALPGALAMPGAILLGALAGLALNAGTAGDGPAPAFDGVSRGAGLVALGLFAALFVLLPLAASTGAAPAMVAGFYQSGALVFGGGHVVLPLLDAAVVQTGQVSADAFLAGYGAAQALPGPLFTFAAYLGVLAPPAGVGGAVLALAALFLPGFLLLVAALPFWDALRRRARAQSAMQGANAAVVGILAAALYDPVFTSAVGGMGDFALAAVCAVALVAWKAPALAVVVLGAAGGMLLALAA
ncbi:chromate efflux transporter [Meridianimarinicoccus sp. RP-17]